MRGSNVEMTLTVVVMASARGRPGRQGYEAGGSISPHRHGGDIRAPANRDGTTGFRVAADFTGPR